MSLQQNPPRAIQLISIDEENKTRTLTKEGEAFLNSLYEPIGIIVFQGVFRRGKSFLASKLANCPIGKGFGVGNDVNRKTLGFWVWSQPIVNVKTGMKMIVIDCEGTNSPKVNESHDVTNFAIASLLASTLILNTTGAIDSKSLEQLELVTKISKMICIDAQKTDDTMQNHSIFAQLLLWVIRDHSLKIVNEQGQPISNNEYVRHSLKQVVDPNSDQLRANQVRQAISEAFPEIKCVTLIRPVADEDQLIRIADLTDAAFNEKFLDQLHDFISLVKTSCPIKTVLDKQYNGPMVVGLLKGILNSLNNGSQPVILDQWTATAQNQCLGEVQFALDQFDNKYRHILQNGEIYEPEQFATKLQMTRDILVTDFQKRALPDFSKQYESSLVQKLDEKILYIDKFNRDTVEKLIKLTFTTLNEEIVQNQSSQSNNNPVDLKLIRTLYQKYWKEVINKIGKSNYINHIWNTLTMEYIWNWFNISISSLSQQSAMLTSQVQSFNKEIKLITNERDVLNRKYCEEVKELQENITNLNQTLEKAAIKHQSEHHDLQEQFNRQSQEYSSTIQKLNHESSLSQLELKSQLQQCESLNQEILILNGRILTLQSIENELKQKSSEYAEAKEKIIELEATIESDTLMFKQQVEGLKKEINEMSDSHSITLNDLELQIDKSKVDIRQMMEQHKVELQSWKQKLLNREEEIRVIKNNETKHAEDFEANTNVLQQRLQVMTERYEALKQSSQEIIDRLTRESEKHSNEYDTLIREHHQYKIEQQDHLVKLKEQMNLEIQNKTIECKDLREQHWKSDLELKSKNQQYEMELKLKSDMLEGNKRRMEEDAEDRQQHKKLKVQYNQLSMDVFKVQSSLESLTKERTNQDEKIKDLKTKLTLSDKRCKEAELSKETEFIKLKVAHEKQLSLLKRSSHSNGM